MYKKNGKYGIRVVWISMILGVDFFFVRFVELNANYFAIFPFFYFFYLSNAIVDFRISNYAILVDNKEVMPFFKSRIYIVPYR